MRDVHLEVARGEFLSILGPNGAGKSTLLKTIAGLLTPEAGSIEMEGRRLHTLPAHQVVSCGVVLVPEGGLLFPHMSVEENLLMGAYSARNGRDVRSRLEQVFSVFPRLAERRRQAAHSLSGGERQMLAIGRGLMARPRLLMLDEPSLGLAPLIVADIFRVLASIHREGVTVVLTEQHVDQALKISSRAYVLEQGRIILEGPAEALRSDPLIKTRYLGL